MFAKLFLLATSVGLASAACPNQCSGHGTCGAEEVCTCYDNWGMGGAPGGDCSDRFCPYELAWVDSPTSEGYVHQYAECANKGICDRETGECACLAGYTGKACARQVCPDDCSGHGTCEYMDELAYGTVFNDAGGTALGSGAGRPAAVTAAWDSGRARACVCDAGWNGINCASKKCPYGNDVLDLTSDNDVNPSQVQTITLTLAAATDRQLVGTGDATFAAWNGKTFALTFTSQMGERFTTIPIKITTSWATSDELKLAIEAALKGLPNNVINDVEVTCTSATVNSVADAGLAIAVKFKGSANQGKQHLLEVETLACGDGCTPTISGIDMLVHWGTYVSSISETTEADYNSFECGRRGKCDSDTGICACFEGFTGEACTEITALV
jgi:hypothetical protein